MVKGLKFCPFCGGEAWINLRGYYVRVECKTCGACGEDLLRINGETMEQTEVRAIEAWNRRPERTCRVDNRDPSNPFCRECSTNLNDEWKYCPGCGYKINGV